MQGESDAAYFIDFHFAASKRWVVIHDLRLEYLDKVAQIDHLLINRFFDIYILETKNYSYGVKISPTGEFLRINGDRYSAMESPIEQNKRHQIVLEEVIKKYDLMPKRLGITITPSFYNYVLVSPKSRVIRPSKERFNTSMVIKADTLRDVIDKRVDKMGNISVLTTVSKISTFETVVEMAKRLAALHKPIKIDCRKRFGIEDAPLLQTGGTQIFNSRQLMRFYCSKCKKTITEKAAKFCWDNKQRFGGKAYCFDCQKTIPVK
ncbi:MAG TPA: nuclease-related domain-containing protein [Thermodesulfovibrionales bacterium]|nr:nuclease-related domain-containing protein [Thermodesulfovibrionales bacterium]